MEVEECPRRWALSSASYPGVWEYPGYPALPNVKGLAGQVIHAGMRRISIGLAQAGCQDVRDSTAVKALRGMGGLSAVLQKEIDFAISRHRENPRARLSIEQIAAELSRDIPEMRNQVQVHLSRLTLVPWRGGRYPGSSTAVSGPLLDGSYPELRLSSTALDWTGTVDLLQIKGGECVIWEFKSGVADERHKDQIRSYLLLWADDKTRNPKCLPVRKLLLSYYDRLVEVIPPDSDALSLLRTDLRSRISAAAEAVATNPPPARPAPDRCRFCPVRHLCTDYWAALQSWGEINTPANATGDAEIVIGNKRGPRSSDATVIVSSILPKHSKAVLTLSTGPQFADLPSGMRARALNVFFPEHSADPERPQLISITGRTEIFPTIE